MKEIPACCGKTMRIHVEMPLHYEVRCDTCDDVIYVKKEKKNKPVMLDD